MVKAASIDKNGFKKGAWSPEEDEKLRAYIVKHGHLNWRELPKFAGLSRCGKSCRLRWMNYLRPDVKRGNFSKDEDDLIIQLHQHLGNQWAKIATNLPGRTDNEIKNHWHTRLKKRVIMQIQTAHNEVSKQHYNETPKAQQQYKAKQLKPETSVSNAAFYPTILESFPMMSSELSDCSYTAVAGVNWMAENNLPSSVEIFEESGEDFWTQPFVVDDYNTHSHDDYILSYNSYYDSMDLIFHQVMHELQENIYSSGN